MTPKLDSIFFYINFLFLSFSFPFLNKCQKNIEEEDCEDDVGNGKIQYQIWRNLGFCGDVVDLRWTLIDGFKEYQKRKNLSAC